MMHNFSIDESQRQMVILALAELSLSRPGWEYATREAVRRFNDGSAETMFDGFRASNADRIRATHAPIGQSWPAPGDDQSKTG